MLPIVDRKQNCQRMTMSTALLKSTSQDSRDSRFFRIENVTESRKVFKMLKLSPTDPSEESSPSITLYLIRDFVPSQKTFIHSFYIRLYPPSNL